MAEALRDSAQDPFNNAFGVSNQGSIAMRMRQNKEAMNLLHSSQQHSQQQPSPFQPKVESQRVQMINNMGSGAKQVGHGLQSASSHKSREINQLRDSRQKERSQQLSNVS